MDILKFILLFVLLISCNKTQKTIELKIVNLELKATDSLFINFKNNTNENYLFYFESKKLTYFPKAPNSLNLVITNNEKPVDFVYSITDPLWLIDENGQMSKEDSISQSNYFDCKNKYNDLFILVPAKSSFILKSKLIDSVDDCGRENYPILQNKISYKTSLKLKLDSSLISKRVMEKINKIKKEKNVKLFQGQIESNSVVLKT